MQNNTNFFTKYRKKLYSVFLALILCLNLAGCSLSFNWTPKLDNTDNTTQSDAYSQNDNKDFTDFTNDLFKDSVTDDTLTLHSFLNNPQNYGINDYEVTLGRYDLEHLDQTSDITDTLNTLKTFDREKLSKAQQLTYDEILTHLNTQLEYSDLYLFDNDITLTTGIQIQLPLILSEYTFNEEKDVQEYIQLVNDTDGFFQNVVDYEKLRSSQGYFMEDSFVDKITAQCKAFMDSATDTDACLISSFNERIDSLGSISDEQKQTYKNQNLAAVKEHVIPGYQILIDGLNSLKGTNKYSGGLCHYPNGDKYFEYLLKNTLGWSKSIDDYNRLLDSYIQNNMILMRRLIKANPNLAGQMSSFKSSLNDPDSILKDLKEHIKNDYPDAPDLNWDIKYVAKSLQDSASPAMYFTPQIDNISQNSIYINPASTKDDELYTTLAHEGYPGHMYQVTYFENQNPDPIRYILEPGGYVEGWATYCELDSYNYIKSEDPDLNTLARINFETILCLYAKVDIGVNHFGWSVSDVHSYLSKYGFDDNSIADEMYSAMVSEPGNYCKYVLGYIGFNELKKAAEDKLGDSFNLKDFHKYVLDMGPVQFDILFDKLDAWADECRLKKAS